MELAYITQRLTGALIGLACAAQDNIPRRGAATHEAMLSGMRMLLCSAEATRDQADACLLALRREQERLAPGRAGRGEGFSLAALNDLEPDLAAQKYALLSGLLPLGFAYGCRSEEGAPQRVMDLIYRGLCCVGRPCQGEDLAQLLRELAKEGQGRGPSGHPGLIQYFINIIELKDLYTQGHSHHVHVVAQAILDSLPAAMQARVDRHRLSDAALLHDVGKLLTPDRVLNKEASLDKDEWHIMRQHPLNGKKILQGGAFADISDWILYHHERMDGRGYYALEPSLIPLASRIITIADTFSAMRTYRIYRPAKSLEETMRVMRECAGTQLDAQIVNHFLSLDMDILRNLECDCVICRQRRAALEGIDGALPHAPQGA